MKLLKYLIFFMTLNACSQNKTISIKKIFNSINIEQILQSKSIEFIKEDINHRPNYSFGLYGEKVDSTITTNYKIHYTIDWEKEKAYPNIFFKGIPLKAPNILTNKNEKAVIITAEIGNNKPFDVRELEVFDNDQVMKLKELLIADYGKPSKGDDSSESNSIWGNSLGNIYIWKKNNFLIKLSIKNECFCKKAEEYSPKKYKERPKGGRYGQLTIYINSKPKFYIND